MKGVLYLEKSLIFRGMVAEILINLGCQNVAFFDEPKEAQAFFYRNPGDYDFLICTGTLKKEGDGIEWAKQLKKEGYKIIFISDRYIDEAIFAQIPFIRKKEFYEEKLKELIDSFSS